MIINPSQKKKQTEKAISSKTQNKKLCLKQKKPHLFLKRKRFFSWLPFASLKKRAVWLKYIRYKSFIKAKTTKKIPYLG